MATKVVPPASTDGQPASATERSSRGLTPLAPATISSAPSAGIATRDTRPGASATTPIIHRPARMDAQRVFAPEITLIAVPLSDPPTGSPRNSPDAMFAAPCAMKSRVRPAGGPSPFGTDWLTPTPWTSVTTATDSAPVNTFST